jgi:hypothetical protein
LVVGTPFTAMVAVAAALVVGVFVVAVVGFLEDIY